MKTGNRYLALIALLAALALNSVPTQLNAFERGGGGGGGFDRGYGGGGGQYHQNQYHPDQYQNRYGDYRNQNTLVVPYNQNGEYNGNYNNGYDNNENNGYYDPMQADPETQGGQIFDSYDPNNR